MSVLELSRVDLLDETYNLTPLFPTLNLTGATVVVALLPKNGKPTGTTVWFSATLASGSVTVRLAAPDADSTGALAVPGTSDLWAKVTTTNGQVDAAKLGRINVSGGSSGVLARSYIGLDTDGVPFYDPNGVGSSAGFGIAADGVAFYVTP